MKSALLGKWMLADGQRSIISTFIGSISLRDQKRFIHISSTPRRWACSDPGRGAHWFLSASSTPAVDERQGLQSGESPRPELATTPFRKRKVALWIGYVGTTFNGLQIVRGLQAVTTIEFELERAIHQAGGILDSNYGHLDKIRWSRSSRTDKGVHSLSTVISMKMEIPSWAWAGDPDGLLLADNINVHLPPTIQIFGVVPVTKSFEARHFCCSRTYHYLLPASLIGICGDSCPEDVGHIIENFRTILNMFQGRSPFHNYTIRRLYRPDTKSKGSWSKRKSSHSTPPPRILPIEDELDEEADLPELSVQLPVAKTQNLLNSDVRSAYWLHGPDLADKVGASHFRKIFDCSCGGLEIYGGAQFVRLSVTGESFMVHQIRKMVATAVAVARGLLPRDTILLSLCRHTRFILPLAPSDGLLLAANSFYPFRLAPGYARDFRESEVGIMRLGELPKLQISKQVSDRVDIFWSDVLLPQLAPQLDPSLPVWSSWLENLSQGTIPDAEMEEVRTSYRNWRTDSQLMMEATDERR